MTEPTRDPLKRPFNPTPRRVQTMQHIARHPDEIDLRHAGAAFVHCVNSLATRGLVDVEHKLTWTPAQRQAQPDPLRVYINDAGRQWLAEVTGHPADQPRTVTLDDEKLLTVYCSGMVSGIATFMCNEFGVPPELAEPAAGGFVSSATTDPLSRHQLLELLHGWIDGSIPNSMVKVTAYNPNGGRDE